MRTNCVEMEEQWTRNRIIPTARTYRVASITIQSADRRSAKAQGSFGSSISGSLEVTARTSEAQKASGIENDLLNIHLSPDKQQSLLQMINDGASDEELKNLLNITTGEAV